MDAFLNGRLVPVDHALVRAEDAGFQHAVGLFETMSAHHGRVFRLDAHLARLAESARELGLAREINTAPLAEAVNQTLHQNKLDRARVRLTVTAGAVSLLAGPTGTPPTPTLLITASPPTEYDPAYFTDGILALIAAPKANPFDPLAGHKTLAYWGRLRALRQAASAGAGEAIWLNVTNHLASGSISNVFLVKDEALLTPIARGEEVAQALAAPVLPGITRAAVIELAERESLPVHRRMLTVEDLLEADEVFLTNSSWQILPVTRIEKKTIGSGKAGPVTMRLRERLLDLIEQETSA